MDEHILKDIHILKLNILGCDTNAPKQVRVSNHCSSSSTFSPLMVTYIDSGAELLDF
jgi:hypothetical protein